MSSSDIMDIGKQLHSYIKFNNVISLTSGKGYNLSPSNFQMVYKRYASDEIFFSNGSGIINFYFTKPRLVQIFTNSDLDFKIAIKAASADDQVEFVELRCDTANKSKNKFTVLSTLFIKEIHQIVPKANYAAKSAYFSLLW